MATARWFPIEMPAREVEEFLNKTSVDIKAYISRGRQPDEFVVNFPKTMHVDLLTVFLTELELYVRARFYTYPVYCYICGGNLWGNGSGDVTDLSEKTITRMQSNPDYGRKLRITWRSPGY